MEVESVFWDPEKVSFSLNRGYNGGQKCCDLFRDISETSDPSPLEQMGGMTAFLDTTLLGEGEWGDDGMYPKEIKKLSLGEEVPRNNYLEGLFHTVQSS